jgi:hypothetical protein
MRAVLVTSVKSVEGGTFGLALEFDLDLEGDALRVADLFVAGAGCVVCADISKVAQIIRAKIIHEVLAGSFLIWLSMFPPCRHSGRGRLRLL